MHVYNIKQGNYQMVLNTPRSATLIDCTEVSPTYSEEPTENYQVPEVDNDSESWIDSYYTHSNAYSIMLTFSNC